MKKVLFLTALLAATLTSVAQKRATAPAAPTYVSKSTTATSDFKPTQGTITAEVGIVGGLFNTTPTLNEGAAKFRYFFKDDIAFRLGLAFGSSSTETPNAGLGTAASPLTTTISKYNSKTFNLGVEKHFSGAERLSTYVGFDLLIGFNGASYSDSTETGATAGSSSNSTTGAANASGFGAGAFRAGSSFGARLTTGADYYFSKKLYLGVEVGLSYVRRTLDAVTTNNTTGGTASPEVRVSNEGKGSNTVTNIVGGLKLGYQF